MIHYLYIIQLDAIEVLLMVLILKMEDGIVHYMMILTQLLDLVINALLVAMNLMNYMTPTVSSYSFLLALLTYISRSLFNA